MSHKKLFVALLAWYNPLKRDYKISSREVPLKIGLMIWLYSFLKGKTDSKLCIPLRQEIIDSVWWWCPGQVKIMQDKQTNQAVHCFWAEHEVLVCTYICSCNFLFLSQIVPCLLVHFIICEFLNYAWYPIFMYTFSAYAISSKKLFTHRFKKSRSDRQTKLQPARFMAIKITS